MNHFNLPYALPFKFVKSTATPGIHMHDSWACEQIKSFEKKAYYKQKWQKADTTLLQCEGSFNPESLKLYDNTGAVVKSFSWTVVYAGTNYSIYQTTFDVSNMAEGVYYLYQRATVSTIDWKAISEPIHVKTTWPNTLLFKYKNSFNRDDVAWSTGIEMYFRCEAGIMEYSPESEIADYINQSANREIIDGEVWDAFKLYIGNAKGVAPYIFSILNHIMVCDYVSIEGLKYTRVGKFDISRAKNYPLVGGSIDIVPSENVHSLQFADTEPLAPGLLVVYAIETDAFGPGATVQIEDVLENG